MHSADITAALRKRRSSQAAIARQLDISKSAVSQVVSGHQRSRRVQAAIAKATGQPVTKLWPTAKPNSGVQA